MSRGGERRGWVGRLGERLAALWLLTKGYRIEARNWRCRAGELDLVARRRGLVVFVEVKTRTSAAAGTPVEAVTPAKRRQLVRLARLYLAGRRGPAPACRFDVVAVDATRFPPRLRHLADVFRADGAG